MFSRLLRLLFSDFHQWEEREKNPHMAEDFGSAAVCTRPGCDAVIWDYRDPGDDGLRADGSGDPQDIGSERRWYQRIRRPKWADTLQFCYLPERRDHRVAQANHSFAEGVEWP